MRNEFVKELGELLNKYHISGVKKLESGVIDTKEFVIIYFTNGVTKKLIVTGDSYIELVENICRCISLKRLG